MKKLKKAIKKIGKNRRDQLLKEAEEMDERGRELSELRDYGHKLLEELRYPAVISMLQQIITHISSIAEEYSKEADKWHEKYDDCLEQNKNLREQIEELTAAGKQQNKELRKVIDAMSIDFAKQMESLRSHHDQEIKSHSEKLQALVATQAMLDKVRSEAEDAKHKLDDKRRQCDAEKVEYENKRKEYDEKIKVNQAELDKYKTLFKKVKDELTKKYNDEKTLREKLEVELAKLKKTHCDNANAHIVETSDSQGDASEVQNDHSSHCDNANASVDKIPDSQGDDSTKQYKDENTSREKFKAELAERKKYNKT